MLARRGMTVRRRSGRAGPAGVARAGLCWRRLTPGAGKCKGVGVVGWRVDAAGSAIRQCEGRALRASPVELSLASDGWL